MRENNRQYVLRYRAVMALLRASGVDYRDKSTSVECLKETVQAKKNIEIYEKFILNSK